MADPRTVPAVLYHYTDEGGMHGILAGRQINPSLAAANPNDARHGEGQYLSDLLPGTMTTAQLSRAFLGIPFLGRRFTHFIGLDVRGLVVIHARPSVYVIPNTCPLDVTGRMLSAGEN